MKTTVFFLIILNSILFSQPKIINEIELTPSIDYFSSSIIMDQVIMGANDGYFYVIDENNFPVVIKQQEIETSPLIYEVIKDIDEKGFAIGFSSKILKYENDNWVDVNFEINDFLNTIEVSENGKIYTGGSNGLIYISSNGGLNWDSIDVGTIGWIYDIQEYNDSLYVVGEFGLAIKVHNDVVYSLDSDTSSLGNLVAILPQPSGLHVFNQEGQIYRSTDFGDTWNLQFEDPTIAFSDYAVSGSMILAVASNSKIVVSTNSGDTWNAIDAGIDADLNTVTALDDVFYIGGSRGLILKYENGNITNLTPNVMRNFHSASPISSFIAGTESGKIIRSLDSGKTWNEVFDTQSGFVNNICVDIDGKHYATTIDGKLFSEQTPLNFVEETVGNEDQGFQGLKIYGKDVFASTVDGNIFAKFEGNNWQKVYQTTLDSNNIVDLEIDTLTNIGFAVGNNGVVLKTTDGGNSWTEIDLSFDYPLMAVEFSGSRWNIAGAFGQFAFSSDGIDWDSTYTDFPNGFNYSDIESYQTGKQLVATTLDGLLLYSKNYGESWDILYNNFSIILDVEVKDNEFLVAGYNGFMAYGNFNDILEIDLSSGWNMISSNVEPDPLSMESVFNEITNDILIVKNGSGKIYVPQFNINTIGDWDIIEGYQIYATSDVNLIMDGTEIIPENISMNLNQGWNMIAYLRNSPQNIETALADIANSGDLLIAKNSEGKIYVPQFNINTIGDMIPGQGYQIYLVNSVVFTYPEN